jgi:RNA polymerase sigma-70 factor (ECF subfamily)
MSTAVVLSNAPHLMDSAPAQPDRQAVALDRFLRGIERRALRIAELSTRDREDALDLVQDAMLAFARNYADKPEADWAPLFHRVLDSRLLDFHRRSSVRRRFRVWFGRADDADGEDPIEQVADPGDPGPLLRLADGETRQALDAALRQLPLRQRQAFLLRMWEGLDVAQTATAMGCGEGSVKTHLSRALAALRTRLEDLR